MFPFDVEDDEDFLAAEESGEPSDFEIDFSAGELTGRIVSGLEAILQWARIALSTDRYFYPQYSWNYGSDLNTLIGKNYEKGYIESEARRMVEETLTVHEDILGIDDFECMLENEKLKATFTIETTYGRGEMDV